jgi:DNA polymerase (family 10)
MNSSGLCTALLREEFIFSISKCSGKFAEIEFDSWELELVFSLDVSQAASSSTLPMKIQIENLPIIFFELENKQSNMEITNKSIAAIFRQLAKLMEFHGENKFKIRSYQNAYQLIRKYPEPVASLDKESLLKIDGIGQAIAEKIIVIHEEGQLPLLEKYKEQTADGVIELLNIRGLGPKKVRTLFDELSITSPGELYYACKENRLVQIKGMGAKTQQKLLEQLEFYLSSKGYIRIDQATELWEKLKTELAALPIEIELTGALRRKMPEVDQIEFLLSREHIQDFQSWLETTEHGQGQQEGVSILFKYHGVSCCAHACSKEEWSHTLLKSTGGAGLMHDSMNGFSEVSYFEQKAWPVIPPEMRDLPDIGSWLDKYDLDDLVELSDIKGLIHAHTDWSDGGLALEQLVSEVKGRGYQYLSITDHSKAAFYANGLNEERLRQQAEQIDQLNQSQDDFLILKGCEVDILNDGRMDLDPATLAALDIVIASVHSNLSMDKEKAMTRLLKAIENPHVHMLGHPTGRLILARNGYEIDHKKIIDACADHRVAIEINANPMRLDLDWEYIPYCMEKGVMISINPDAHSLQDLDYVKYGVDMGRKGGLTRSFCLNSLSANAFLEYLKAK